MISTPISKTDSLIDLPRDQKLNRNKYSLKNLPLWIASFLPNYIDFSSESFPILPFFRVK